MALRESIRREILKISAECIDCSRGWVYEADEETGEAVAIPCWMCDTLDAQQAGLERLGD